MLVLVVEMREKSKGLIFFCQSVCRLLLFSHLVVKRFCCFGSLKLGTSGGKTTLFFL